MSFVSALHETPPGSGCACSRHDRRRHDATAMYGINEATEKVETKRFGLNEEG